MGFDEAAFLSGIGLTTPVGERGYSALERLWARPTADINGIWGGYTGAGSKTVIASEASAKISFRLVPEQDPDAVMDQFRQFVTDRLPPDATATFADFARAPGIEVNVDSAHVRSALDALAEEYGKPALLMGCGGSIPVVDIAAVDPGTGLAPDGLRAGRRSGAQPEREVRGGVLSPRHTFACATAGEVRRRIDRAAGAYDAAAQNPCICGTPGRYTGCLSVIAWLTGGFSRP